MLDHRGRDEETTVAAWDTARVVHYAGLALHAGFLAEHEAWGYVARAAALARQRVGSWEEYGRSFLYGRWFWAGSVNADLTEYEKVIADLLADDASPWRTLPWDTELAPLATRTADPGDPGGPLRSLSLRVGLDCPACFSATVLRTVDDRRCSTCGAEIEASAREAWTTAVGFGDDVEEPEGLHRKADTRGPRPTRDELEVGTNLGDVVIRVSYRGGAPRCACGHAIDDAAVRDAASRGAFGCACGRNVPVTPAPALLRACDPRARYVVGGPLRLGEPGGLLTLLFSER